jgi:hypothetical protein
MTEPVFEIRSTQHPSCGASVWMDDLGHLHIKMSVDNAVDVIFEDSHIVRPRTLLCQEGGRIRRIV